MNTKKLSERRAEQARKAGEEVLRNAKEAQKLKLEGHTCEEIAKIMNKPEFMIHMILQVELK